MFSEDFWVEDQYQEKPTREECCICNGELESVQTIIEARPTGEYGETEMWGYCSKCWASMEKLRQWGLDLEALVSKLALSPSPTGVSQTEIVA